ncbi:MAG TPA: glycoside hydrolase family 3 C-terminal domain-containing protein [Pseudonocardiaceae bacterium]|nr:glycoside hydrolase family 3 C-terminal domain-containing protein [Pseudonocardiaceae bacterium]
MSHSEVEARIETAIGALDLPAKVRLLAGAALFALHPEPAIGLTELAMSDGPTGVRGPQFRGGPISALLPNASLLAQSWNTEVTHEAGELLAEEAMAQHVHVVLGPTINLHRTPLGGRLFEAYSEDPLLTGALATAYTRGLQGHGIAATLKHFLANESETERTTADSVVDPATLREVYLLPFEMAVADAGPWAVMASYNRINGTTATEHGELIDGVLKGEWGYDGLVMSDWFATTSTAASANGGLDLVMPGPDTPWGDKLLAAVRAGEVKESTVDEHVRRVLRLAIRVGALGGREWPTDLPAPADERRRARLRRLAAGGMTVLVNKNDTLPLSAEHANVVLVGRHALATIAQGGGSAQVRPPHVVTVAEGLVDALGPDRVSIVDGVEVRNRPESANPDLLCDPRTGRAGLRVTALDAQGDELESRQLDATETIIEPGDWLDRAATVELTAEFVLDAPSRLRVGLRGLGDWEFRLGETSQTVRHEHTGDLGEGLLTPPDWTTDLLVSPGDRIIARRTGHTPHTMASLIARPAPKPAAEVIAAAARAATNAEVAVVVVGLTQEQETEGVDKATLALPGEQDDLVAAVAGAAKRTVVVVNAATPVLMPWLSAVDAVLWAGLPGQEAGPAVADALLGLIEPAGRLVTTFPARDGQGPAWSTQPVEGRLPYTEGRAVGYRGWHARGERPLFWFGHGLGYTTWRYDAAEPAGAVDTVRVTVTNTGLRTGRETVQVYLDPGDPELPVRLIGWAGIELAAGCSGTVEVACDPRAQRIWDTEAGGWRPLPATGTVLIARGLGDVRITLPVTRT